MVAEGCFRTSEPAIASTGMMRKNRPTSIARAWAMLRNGVLEESPANAEPLLLAGDATP